MNVEQPPNTKFVSFVGGGPLDGSIIELPDDEPIWWVTQSPDAVYKSQFPAWAKYEVHAGYAVFVGYTHP